MTAKDQDVYTVPEAGARLGLSRAAAYAAAQRGDLPTIRIGRRIMVPRAAFARLLERAEQGGKDNAAA